MQGTSLPRMPGRDYAGTVVEGPAQWIGAEVWGTGGEIGYSINGSHADRRPGSKSSAQAAHAVAGAGGSRRRELLWALDLHTTIGIDMAGSITGGFLKKTRPPGQGAFSNVGVTYRL